MRAMVLAAGLGTRLRPLTELLPKPAVPLLNRPMAMFALETLHAAGIRQVVLNTHWLPEAVSAALGEDAGLGMELSYSHEPELLGTGGGVRKARRFLGEQRFALLNGDALVEVDLAAVVEAHVASGALATLVLRAEGWERYGAVEHDGAGRIVSVPGARLPGKPTPAHKAMFTGVHVIEPALLDALPPSGPAGIIRDGYARLLARGAVLGAFLLPAGAFFSDCGTPGSYLDASLGLLARRGLRHLVAPCAEVRSGQIGEGVVVGDAARVAAGVRLERCIVWPGTHVTRDLVDAIAAPGHVVPVGESR